MSSRSTIPFLGLLCLMAPGGIPLARAQFIQQGGRLTVFSGGVAVSADGNTVIVGDESHNGNVGGALVFTRGNGVWSQQGGELVGSAAVPSTSSSGAVPWSTKDRLWRCRPTETRHWLVGHLMVATARERRGSLCGATAYGFSKAPSWSRAVLERIRCMGLSRHSPLMGTQLS